MKPLEQFICDGCGEIIEESSQGYLEWLSDPHSSSGLKEQEFGFRIVHHALHSPRKESQGDCYRLGSSSSQPLVDALGDSGAAWRLHFLDVGAFHDPEGEGMPRAKNLREYVELLRRLTVPYYEEARQYWGLLGSEPDFIGVHERAIYGEDILKELIRRGKTK